MQAINDLPKFKCRYAADRLQLLLFGPFFISMSAAPLWMIWIRIPYAS